MNIKNTLSFFSIINFLPLFTMFNNNNCSVWPCSKYSFCPNAYSDSAWCSERKSLSKKGCLLCISPAAIVKTVCALNYLRENVTTIEDSCNFALTGSSLFASNPKTQLCCLCTDALCIAGTLFIGCILSPWIGPNGWNCCVKKDERAQEDQEEMINVIESNNE